MVSVGYGDITPVTKKEKLLTMTLTILNCAIFGYAVSVIGEIVSSLQSKNYTIKRDKFLVSNYLDKRIINSESKRKVM